MMTAMDGRKKNYPDAANLYKKGLSIAEIASFYQISRQAMWEWMKNHGVKFRSNRRYGRANHFYRGRTKASDYAQNLLETAIQKGIVVRKTHCEQCGAIPVFKDGRTGIQAHHPDYNKPLEVMWLCQPCHHQWHKTNKAIPRED